MRQHQFLRYPVRQGIDLRERPVMPADQLKVNRV